jgi:3-oxoacyl-[acyl-carrier-protein] synthase III
MTLRLGPQRGIALAGTGSAFPSDLGTGAVLTNADVYRILLGEKADGLLAARGWRADHPRDTWGVERREWIRAKPSDASNTADVGALATCAARRALDDAGSSADGVDLLIAATSTPARITSVLAAAIGHELGVTAPCLDVRAGGAGGLDAWLTAARFVSDACRTVLVIAAETASLYVRPDDLASALLYGDGAAGLVLKYAPGDTCAGLVGAVLGRTDAAGRPFTVPGSLPPTSEELGEGRYRFQRPDAAYQGAMAAAWAGLCEELRRSFPAAVDAADHFLPYAVTASQVGAAAAALGVGPERTFETLARHGCLGCPGPLVALDVLRRDGRAHVGHVVVLAAVAGGVSMTGMLWRM